MHRLTSHFDKEETISRVLLLHNELLKKVDGCGWSFANALQNVTTPELSQEAQLGNTILVKLELWESVMVIISFGLPLTYAYATLRQSVAGNSTFWGFFAI